jgi:hypothetical protein
MTLADLIRQFGKKLEKQLDNSIWDELRGEDYGITYVCDPVVRNESTSGPMHSMRCARLAAAEAKLPPWILEVAEKEFACSCEIFYGFRKFVRILRDLESNCVSQENADNLHKRLLGFWDYEIQDAIEEVCRDDSEALEIARRRFEIWRKSLKKKPACSLYEFLGHVSDPVLSGLALLALRRNNDKSHAGPATDGNEAIWDRRGDPLGF